MSRTQSGPSPNNATPHQNSALSSKTLHFPSPRHLHALYAGREENLAHAERALGVKLISRDAGLKIEAPPVPLARAEALFSFLNDARGQGMTIRTPDFHRITDAFARDEGEQLRELTAAPVVIATNRKSIVPKTLGQKLYLQSMLVAPAGFWDRSGRYRKNLSRHGGGRFRPAEEPG